MSEFEIEDYSPEQKDNPWTDHVAALDEAGEGKAMTVRVASSAAKRQRVLFQRAANAIDKTARCVEQSDDGEEVALTFVLKPREARRRGSVESVTAE